jgi:topoisomerase-4 subunit B
MSDLFSNAAVKRTQKKETNAYDASSIEVLEGLEPVRKRPGMYIGGTDERALHHLVAEVLDNSMDEAVAGHATDIWIGLTKDQYVAIADNGRGIPVDPHPKFPKQSALEVILTTLHSGGKFSDKSYATSGGLHGVGVSVVNALSDDLKVIVNRDGKSWEQSYSRGVPQGKLKSTGISKDTGTTITFHPDHEIFGKNPTFKPERLYRIARSKAYLHRGVTIHWQCDLALINDKTPEKDSFHFAGGIHDYLLSEITDRPLVGRVFAGTADLADKMGRVEWAICWPDDHDDGFFNSYCNTVPTPEGGTHESGFRTAMARSIKAHGDRIGHKKSSSITADDIMGASCGILSLFIRNPQFQGQTKEKLASAEAMRLVDNAIKDHLDHWLADNPKDANDLLEFFVERADERTRKKIEKESRKGAARRQRLPGKLADCTRAESAGTEIFLVEGDSAGGSAKQARNRETQAILPLRGKILNVANATGEKLEGNKELADLVTALGAGTGRQFDVDKLRYGRVIIMTDADVDGAHIAALLITFFFLQMRPMITAGRLYLAQPPLYRLSAGGKSIYARDEAEREKITTNEFKGRKVELSRFKGLGEMMPAQLKETTMDPSKRSLIRVDMGTAEKTVADLVERLMGKSAESRFLFIQENAQFVQEIDV